MINHTKNPWDDGRLLEAMAIKRNDGGKVEILQGSKIWANVYHPKTEFRMARARRIVACVNACRGIPTAMLEEAKDGSVLNIAVSTVTRERDEALALVKQLAPEPSADVVERIRGIVQNNVEWCLQTDEYGPDAIAPISARDIAPIIEAEVERRVRKRISRIEATELIYEIHRRAENVGDDEDFDVSVGRDWYDSFCACLEDNGKGTTKGTSDDRTQV